ncbi:MAG: rhombosortase [Neptuniibacter sp.]
MMQSISLSTITTALRGGYLNNIIPVTCGIVLISLLLSSALIINNAVELLSFNYHSITHSQQYWRLLTGHMIHSSWDHLFWDLITFALANAYLEHHDRVKMLFGFGVGILGLNLFLLSPLASIQEYSGLSGILYTQIILAASVWATKNKSILGFLPLTIILIKTLFEVFSDSSAFMQNGWQLYWPAHLVGAVCALAVISLWNLKSGTILSGTLLHWR